MHIASFSMKILKLSALTLFFQQCSFVIILENSLEATIKRILCIVLRTFTEVNVFFSFLKEVPLQKMKFHFERDAFLYYVCLAIKLRTSPGKIIMYIIKISKYQQQCRNQHFSESRKKCSGSIRRQQLEISYIDIVTEEWFKLERLCLFLRMLFMLPLNVV